MITPATLTASVASQVVDGEPDYYSAEVTDANQVHTITLLRNTNASAPISLYVSSSAVSSQGCGVPACTATGLNPICRLQVPSSSDSFVAYI